VKNTWNFKLISIEENRSEKFHILRNLFIKFLIGNNQMFYRRHFNLPCTAGWKFKIVKNGSKALKPNLIRQCSVCAKSFLIIFVRQDLLNLFNQTSKQSFCLSAAIDNWRKKWKVWNSLSPLISLASRIPFSREAG